MDTIEGSSLLGLGWWSDLSTGDTIYHDLHHFNPSIRSYNLQRCQNDLPEALNRLGAVHWSEGWASFRLRLWDKFQGKMVPFPEEIQCYFRHINSF